MKVKIVKAQYESYWYSDKIGAIYDVVEDEHHPNDYITVDENGTKTYRFIQKNNCTVLLESPSEYQKAVARTLIDKPGFAISDKDIMAIWCSVGLSGESGEVAELLKKGIFHQHGVDEEKLKKELGDVCWYLAGLCTVYGFSLTEVMQTNIEKLLERYPNGYNSEDSKKRVDTKG